MTVVVTGVGGFIGAHVAARLAAEGMSVVGVDDFSTGRRINVPPAIELIEHDLSDPRIIYRLPRSCEFIAHLAGQSSGEISFEDPIGDLKKNVHSTINLVRYGIEAGTRRFVLASSMTVYGDVGDIPVQEDTVCQPLSCYGISKLAAESYLRVFASQLPFVIFRMFNVYGPGQDMLNLRQGMISIYLSQALSTGHVRVKGSLERFRDFVFIDDVVEAWYRAIIREQADGRILNLGTGRRTTVGELLDQLKTLLPAMSWHVDGTTQGDQHGIRADTSLLRESLGLNEFVPLEHGLARFVSWARSKTNTSPPKR